MSNTTQSELIEIALDWAVAKAEGRNVVYHDGSVNWPYLVGYSPSTDWSQGGPILEREGITVSKEEGLWSAYFRDHLFEEDCSEHWQVGPTPLIAAMRCYVASKLGNSVEVPEELTWGL